LAKSPVCSIFKVCWILSFLVNTNFKPAMQNEIKKNPLHVTWITRFFYLFKTWGFEKNLAKGYKNAKIANLIDKVGPKVSILLATCSLNCCKTFVLFVKMIMCFWPKIIKYEFQTVCLMSGLVRRKNVRETSQLCHKDQKRNQGVGNAIKCTKSHHFDYLI
jgi:hypothetical protein